MERKDSWQDSEDQFLANMVIEHIKRGSTQLAAFEDAGNRLRRSSAACGFRWNSEVRKQYEEAIQEAKECWRNLKRNKSRKQELQISSLSESNQEMLIEQVKFALNRIEDQIKGMYRELDNRSSEIKFIRQKLDILMSPEQKLSEDYNALIEILKRAKNLGILDRTS